MNWILRLECGHSLEADDGKHIEREYCPACGFEMLVTETYIYREETS